MKKLHTQIYAKSALVKEQLDTKVNIGCDGIEIQLLSELIDGSVGHYKNVDDVFDLDSFNSYNITVVHAPILSFYGLSDVTLEDFVDNDIIFLEQVFKIANHFGKLNNRRTGIVVHSESNIQIMQAIGETWKRAVMFLGYLLFKYPYTELYIENVTPNRGTINNIILCNNFKFDNIEMVKRLREELHTDRIGTVLDTCHAKISKMYMDKFFSLMPDKKFEDLSMENYFKQNKDVIKLVHFADAAGSGYGKGQHGTKLCNDNIDFVESIINLYNKYNYTCPITLEVEEQDFKNSPNYKESKETIDNYR